MIAGGWEEAFREGNVLGHVVLGPDSTIGHEVDPFRRVIEEIVSLNERKRSDYASTDDPFSNFRRTAEQTGLTPGQVVEVLIGVKQARLRELSDGRTPNNESIRDTLIDRAVYSIIRLAMHDQEENS